MSLERIVVLGRLGMEPEGREAPVHGLPGRRAELVFAYLAVEHARRVSRDELANALWPATLPDSWTAALRGVVSDVRRFLKDSGVDPAEVLATGRRGYQLRLPAQVVVDIDEARAAIADAHIELAAGAPALAAAHAARAAALAQLPFLPSHDGEWVSGVQADLGSMYVEALELEARARTEAGELRAAVVAADRLVAAEPFRETGHQLLIRLLGAAHDRSGAADAYEHCKAVLSSQLGVAPSPETDAVFRSAMQQAPSVNGAPPPPVVLQPDHVRALSVLVVDDHAFQRRTALKLLSSLGVTNLSEARDGAAALEMVAGFPAPDVIICELDLPGMDGVEFIRRVAERRPASAVIIASRLDSTIVRAVEHLTEASGLELLGAIEKPVTSRKLAALLTSYRPDPAEQQRAGPPVTAAEVTRALDDERMVERFRPTVDLSSGDISGAEILTGWEDAAHRWIAPPAEMAAVEAGALINRFVDRELEIACAHLAVFERAGLGVSVSVRIPARCLGDIGCADRFAEIVRGGGAETGKVVCVVGERALRSDAVTLAALTRLRLKGFGLCADGFASAHVTVDQPRRVPLTAIRVDPRLVSGAGGDPDRAAVLEETLDRWRRRGLAVTAEGCDSGADFDLLERLGCGHAEGAFIGEPMPGDQFPAWARRWNPPSSPAADPI